MAAGPLAKGGKPHDMIHYSTLAAAKQYFFASCPQYTQDDKKTLDEQQTHVI